MQAAGTVAWIANAPIKGLGLSLRREAELGLAGIEGDRAFYLVDDEGRLTNAKRAGNLLRASAEASDGRLLVRLPDGSAGSMQREFRVYGRLDEPCDGCGTPIEKTRVGGRGTWFCPHCQAL